MTKQDEPIYIISIAARICETHPQTLRQYERLGLLRPTRVGRNRLYSQADIERLRQIQRFTQEMGVNLAGVEVILNLLDRMEQVTHEAEQQMQTMRQFMDREIERVRREVEARFERGQRAKQLVPISETTSGPPARTTPIRNVDKPADDAE